MTTNGSMNALSIGVTPSHSDVFLNVVSGVNRDNVRMLADGLAKYMERRAEVEEADDAAVPLGDNPFGTPLSQFDAVLARYAPPAGDLLALVLSLLTASLANRSAS